jgi:tubulin--tyrosine ligase
MPTITTQQQTTTTFLSNSGKIKIHNHFINNFLIGNKKALFQTMTDYYTKKGDDVFNYLPLTFHICNGL